MMFLISAFAGLTILALVLLERQQVDRRGRVETFWLEQHQVAQHRRAQQERWYNYPANRR